MVTSNCCCSECAICRPGTAIHGGWQIDIDGIVDDECSSCEGYNGMYILDDVLLDTNNDYGLSPVEGTQVCSLCESNTDTAESSCVFPDIFDPYPTADPGITPDPGPNEVGCDGWYWQTASPPFESTWVYRIHCICLTVAKVSEAPDIYQMRVTFVTLSASDSGVGSGHELQLNGDYLWNGSEVEVPVDCNEIDIELEDITSSGDLCDASSATIHVTAL